MAAKAAPSALVVATRAADGGCSPGHVPAPQCPTGTEDGRVRGGGAREELHGYAPEDALPQAAGALYFAVEPQERVQRRTVEQIVDPVLEVPMFHMVVPQMVEQRWTFFHLSTPCSRAGYRHNHVSRVLRRKIQFDQHAGTA